MTEAEKQEIIATVLSSIKTNSLSIPQMTPVTSVPSDAYIELNRGRKIAVETIISTAVQRALAEADVITLATRIETIGRQVERDIRSLGNEVDSIPRVYVDDELDASSGNPISNSAITNAVSKIINLSNAISEIPEIENDPEDYQVGMIWQSGDIFVAHTFRSGNEIGKTRILMHRPSTGMYYSAWIGAPEGLSIQDVSATSRLWLVGNNIFQGTGRDGIIQPLGAMMVQHNILSQSDYNLLNDYEKDKFELYITY